MCFGAECPACSKKSWRGCGNHIDSALAGVPKDQWCTCEPRVTFRGQEYPPAAKMQIPGMGWLSSMLGGGSSTEEKKKKEDL